MIFQIFLYCFITGPGSENLIVIMKNKIFLCVYALSLVGFFVSANFMHAADTARFELRTPQDSLSIGSQVTIQIILHTTEGVNAFSTTLFYPSSQLELVSLNDNNSGVGVWVLKNTKNPGVVVFEGGFLKPFPKGDVEIIKINLKVKDNPSSSALLRLEKGAVYIADGRGTRYDVSNTSTTLTINKEIASESGEEKDTTPPVIEKVSVTQNPFEKNLSLVTFSIHDDISGVKDGYVRFRTWFGWSDWILSSPTNAIPKEAWSFQIMASDNSGNKTIYNGYVPSELLKKLLTLIILFSLGFFTLRFFSTKGVAPADH